MLWNVSCVGWCFSGANIRRSVLLKWTEEKAYSAKASLWKDRQWRTLLLRTCMYWSASCCTVELHFGGFHREKNPPKKLWLYVEVSWCLHGLELIGRMMSTEPDTTTEARHMLRKTCGGCWRNHDVWREYEKELMDSDGGWSLIAYRSICAVLMGIISSLIFASLIEAQPWTSPGFPPDPSCWLMLRLTLDCLC